MPSYFLEKLRAAARNGFGAANGNASGPFTAASAAVLAKAAWEQDTATVRNIVTRWPEAVNTASDDGLTLLHCAAAGMDSAQIDWLLARGADKNARDKNGDTPLHYAAQSQFSDGTQKLLAARAEADARNNKSETPLYYAVMFERAESIDLLIAAGADDTAARHDGETPRSLAPKEDKQRPGGLPAGSTPTDMTATLDVAIAAVRGARQQALATAAILESDMTLHPAVTVRKRSRSPV
ncbi:MAG: ankyrin repeat domain-containing protein [Alphaproteobacteria bacterium]|nr:ankyrin repeat domain-containing protein [Alphaproteobacteria bacterium]